MHPLAALAAATLILAGCSWFQEEKPRLEGKRIAVMSPVAALVPDAPSEAVVLPPPRQNADWPQPGGMPGHSMQHLIAGDPGAGPVLEIDAGSGGSHSSPLMAPPVIAAGRVYVMDTDHKVHAFDAVTGGKLWSTRLLKDSRDDDAMVGGLAFDQGRLYVATGFGDLIALDANAGSELWRQAIGMPMHGPPSVDAGRIFVTSVDNVLHARSTIDGSELWPPRRAIVEPAALLGSANPAISGGLVIAPFSSGEIMAVRVDNGRLVWVNALGSARRTDELALLADIRARPVVDGQTVYAISYSGSLAAIDLVSGQIRWEREIGGINAPWLAGRFLFVVDNSSQLVCLNAATGSVVWVTQLRVFEDEKNFKDPIIWIGPLLASDRLIVFGSHGEAETFSPYDGRQLGRAKLKAGVTVEPAVAGGTLFVLDLDGRLTLFR